MDEKSLEDLLGSLPSVPTTALGVSGDVEVGTIRGGAEDEEGEEWRQGERWERYIAEQRQRIVTLDAIERWSQYSQTLECMRRMPSVHSLRKNLVDEQDQYVLDELKNSSAHILFSSQYDQASLAKASQKISLFAGDITQLSVDAIVNAAGPLLAGYSGVNGCVKTIAGPQLYDEYLQLLAASSSSSSSSSSSDEFQLPPSEPLTPKDGVQRVWGNGKDAASLVVTKGYSLPSKYVMNVIGPQIEDPELLGDCYDRCLSVAANCQYESQQIRSIAFCCISTGTFGYPPVKAAHVAIERVGRFLCDPLFSALVDQIDRVVFCIKLPRDHEIYEHLLSLYFPASLHAQ